MQETNANGTKDYAYDHRGNLLSVTSGEEEKETCIHYVWIWFIIKVSEKVSGNTKHQIQNEFLYYFIWLWHSYGEISILGLLCAIGVQITDIVIAILCLFSDISKELLGACWVTSLIVVLFVSGGVGIIETGNESKRWLEKIAMYLISIAVFFGAAYFLYPMLQYIFKF